MTRVAVGFAVAVALAVLMGVPSILGVETWKWVLGIVGLMIFAWGGMLGNADRKPGKK
jgi:hypothetical protein